MISTIKHGFLVVVLLVVAMSLSTIVNAQDRVESSVVDSSSVFLLVRAMPDSVLLRWAPDSYRLWMIGNKYGYKVTRTCLIRNGAFVDNPITELLTPTALKALPLAEWETMAEKDDYAGVAAEAIYGDGFEVDAGHGGIMDIVNRSTEQENRFGFALLAADLSRDVAIASGLMFVDKQARKGEKYIYRVFPAQVPEGLRVDTGYFFTGVDEFLPLPSPVNVKAEPSDKSITLTWDALSQEGFFTAFWVERSDDGGANFKKLDNSPVINTTPEGFEESRFHYYMDTIADNNKTYHYRVLGVTPFGELSPPSAIVKTKGKNEISSVPRISLAESLDGVTLNLEWELELLPGEVVDGVRLFRSHRFEADYEIIADNLPVMHRQFVDVKPLPTGYYRMQAVNMDGGGPLGTPKMVQMVDSIPPAAPLGLTAKADTSGRVQISWEPNEEPDLYGYRVFRANSRHEEFSQITVESVYTSFYTDTISLRTLSKKVYYKILAVDQRQNWSEFSEILEVDRPDIIPPAPPRIASAKSIVNGIELNWVLSPSPDVAQQLLYRNSENNRQWQLLKNLNAESTQYTDSTVMPDVLYRYLFVVVDSAGNESVPTKHVGSRFSRAETVDPAQDLKIKFNRKNDVYTLVWVYESNAASLFYIYVENEGAVSLFTTVAGNLRTFIIPQYIVQKGLKIAMIVENSSGQKSDISKFISIQ